MTGIQLFLCLWPVAFCIIAALEWAWDHARVYVISLLLVLGLIEDLGDQ